ncbi:MAG: T9SS type A sorting domain-containing protein [Bacteroidetes bacterium]|nr:T9SS type A sorting domain-containing protein [Bacteroidota bacterium]
MKNKIRSFSLQFFLFLFLIPFGNISHSQITRISIANGNWNNPAIWSPTGVPTLADDSIIINTDVVFNQKIRDGLAMIRINTGKSLIDLGNDTAAFGGHRFVVDGYFSVGVLAVGMMDSATVKGGLNVYTDVAQSGIFIVQPTGQFCIGQQLATSDDFINNGSVRADSWVNGAIVTGNSGKFCIANSFINSDAISGTLDICDATPGTIYDVNMGTISPSITYCASGPCGLCPAPTGIANEFQNGIPLKVFPNPFSKMTQLEINPAFLNSNLDLIFVMYDVTGKEVTRETITNSRLLIERGNLSDGIYFYRLTLGGNAIASGKLIAE